jgi:hypothetical protein
MEQPSAQPIPNAPKSVRKNVEIALYALLGLLFLAFVLLQTNANRKYAVELTDELENEAFVYSWWDSSANGMLYTRNNIVMLAEDGIAVRIYLDSVKDMYAGETSENSTRNELQETNSNIQEATEWSVRVSIFNRITVKVGENVLVVHQDEFGKIDYLIEDGYKIYYKRPMY